MRFPNLPFVVLDTETTGFVPKAHRIIEFASMRFQGEKGEDTYEELFFIDETIPPHVEVITRIRSKDLEGKAPIEEKREEILSHIGKETMIVGQNVGFDLAMLKGEGIDLTDRPWIDTSMLASLVFPEMKSYSLGYVSAVLQLNHKPIHRALGDVRATYELLGHCWERLCQLPPDLLQEARVILSGSSKGYKALAKALPKDGGSSRPKWLSFREEIQKKPSQESIALPMPKLKEISLVEETPDSSFLQKILNGAASDATTVHWIGVKNLEAALRHLTLPKEARVLYPPFLLPDADLVQRLGKQKTFTAAEATLLLKMRWYTPYSQKDIPLHGDEKAVWNGKISCTETSVEYTKQFQNLPSVLVLDHRQLLAFLADPAHEAHGSLNNDAHIIIDDASMLEDTATKAYGWYCSIDHLRAAAEGDADLTRITDLTEIFAEKTRGGEDIHHLMPSDLSQPELKGLRTHIEVFLEKEERAAHGRHMLGALLNIFEPKNLKGRITWIERQWNGQTVLQSVPENVASFLQEFLYTKFPTSLLVPPGSDETLQNILPQQAERSLQEQETAALPELSLLFEENSIEEILKDPPAGKTVILAPSKRRIEEYFIDYMEILEEQNVTLLCQGFSGGRGRTTAEFLSASAPAILIITPWMYETLDLPEGTVHSLVLEALPFDHPKQLTTARRSASYENGFEQYTLARLEHRLFRILRTFCSQKTKEATFHFLDKRLKEKTYGKRVRAYLEGLVQNKEQKSESGQMTMF